MSLDYPDRKVWLAKRRRLPRSAYNGRIHFQVWGTGKNKDPKRFHAHRRLKGAMRMATGLNSYAAHDAEVRTRLAG